MSSHSNFWSILQEQKGFGATQSAATKEHPFLKLLRYLRNATCAFVVRISALRRQFLSRICIFRYNGQYFCVTWRTIW